MSVGSLASENGQISALAESHKSKSDYAEQIQEAATAAKRKDGWQC